MIAIPSYIDQELWTDFVEGRKEMQKQRIPFTAVAQKRLLMKCMKLHDDGFDVNQCLEESICNCWRSVFPPKGQQVRGQPNRQEAQENRNMQGALDWASQFGDTHATH